MSDAQAAVSRGVFMRTWERVLDELAAAQRARTALTATPPDAAERDVDAELLVRWADAFAKEIAAGQQVYDQAGRGVNLTSAEFDLATKSAESLLGVLDAGRKAAERTYAQMVMN